MAKHTDPTIPIREKAASFAGVDEGTSCTQGSFKVGKQAFLYIGPQGGRFKAMFKLGESRGEAERLAEEEPDNYQVGSTAWVTARFSMEQPMPKERWQRWLNESYETAAEANKPKATKKKAVKKKAEKKKR